MEQIKLKQHYQKKQKPINLFHLKTTALPVYCCFTKDKQSPGDESVTTDIMASSEFQNLQFIIILTYFIFGC